jgi:hypothetical protein
VWAKDLIVDCEACWPGASLENWARLRRRRRAKARRVMSRETPVKTTPARKMLRGRLGRSWEDGEGGVDSEDVRGSSRICLGWGGMASVVGVVGDDCEVVGGVARGGTVKRDLNQDIAGCCVEGGCEAFAVRIVVRYGRAHTCSLRSESRLKFFWGEAPKTAQYPQKFFHSEDKMKDVCCTSNIFINGF